MVTKGDSARIEAKKFPGAAFWASYLINGDDSGLSPWEVEGANQWLERIAPYRPVSYDGEVYFSHAFGLHTGLGAHGGDLLDYVCHKQPDAA